IAVALPPGQHYLNGNGTDFTMVFKLETICGTDEGSNANNGGANCWCSHPRAATPTPDGSSIAVRVGRKSVSSRFNCGWNKPASSFLKASKGALLNARA